MVTPISSWATSPEILLLSEGEVHVWRAWLDLPQSSIQALEQTLSDDERVRAQRFRFVKDRTHFIAARGLLRAILGRYLLREPRTLSFSYNAYGKPALAEMPESVGTYTPGQPRATTRVAPIASGRTKGESLSFNVTHAQGMALYAVTRNHAIGVDLEYIQRQMEWEAIAERFFSPYEVSMLRAVPPQMRHIAFFNCWTRKEAYIKARGMGLSLALDQFDVSLIPGEPAALLGIREEGQDISNWSLYELYPGNDYIAALALEGHASSLKCWQMDL
jgi:4'-phosphopantetheinyl transferase